MSDEMWNPIYAPPITPTQLGILKDIAADKINLDEIGNWMRDQLAQIIFRDGPMLIGTQGPSVFLTEAGRQFLAECNQLKVLP